MSYSKRLHLSFNERVAQLVQFKQRFGHTNVPKRWPENVQLANWVITQRQLYSSKKLETDRQAMLESIGFSFSRLHDPIQDALIRIDTLKRYRSEMNSLLAIPSRNDQNAEYASFAAWLHRLRRLSRGGGVPDEVIEVLSKENISLADAAATSHYVGGMKQESDAFEANYANFMSWLDKQEAEGQPRELTYRASKTSKDAERAYRFVEHMLTKARHGILPAIHRERLTSLQCLINGKLIQDVLNPAPSIRSVDGGSIRNATLAVDAAKLRAEIAQAHADSVTSEAAQLIAEAQRRSQEAVIRARKANEEADLVEANARERMLRSKQTLSTSEEIRTRDNEYITTAELSMRIKYDERTIRERLKDRVFILGVHYTNGFGRKILFIWNKIEADMLDGKFDSLDL